MTNQHSLPTPPPSADVPQLPPRQAGQNQQNPFTSLTFPQGKSDFLTCHVLSNQIFTSAQMALVAQSSIRGENTGGTNHVNEHIPRYTAQHNHPSQTVPCVQHGGGDHGNMQQLQNDYYGNIPSIVLQRHSTSTPSPSQQSLSSPPRCESVDSNMSVISDESASSVAHFNRFGPINSTTRGNCSSTSPLPMPSQGQPPSYYGVVQGRQSPERYAAYNAARESPRSCYPDVPNNDPRFYDNQESYDSCAVAVDLSKPNSRHFEADNPHKQELDLNHNIVVPEALPADNAEPVWRPW